MNSTHPGNHARTITVVILSEAKDLPDAPHLAFDVGFNVTTELVPPFQRSQVGSFPTIQPTRRVRHHSLQIENPIPGTACKNLPNHPIQFDTLEIGHK